MAKAAPEFAMAGRAIAGAAAPATLEPEAAPAVPAMLEPGAAPAEPATLTTLAAVPTTLEAAASATATKRAAFIVAAEWSMSGAGVGVVA